MVLETKDPFDLSSFLEIIDQVRNWDEDSPQFELLRGLDTIPNLLGTGNINEETWVGEMYEMREVAETTQDETEPNEEQEALSTNILLPPEFKFIEVEITNLTSKPQKSKKGDKRKPKKTHISRCVKHETFERQKLDLSNRDQMFKQCDMWADDESVLGSSSSDSTVVIPSPDQFMEKKYLLREYLDKY